MIALVGGGLLGLITIVLIAVADRQNPEPINPTTNQMPPKAGVSTKPPQPTPTSPSPNPGPAAGVSVPPPTKVAIPNSVLPPPSSSALSQPPQSEEKVDQNSYRVVASSQFGFSFELPEYWEHRLEDDALFLSPPDDSPESKEIWGDLQVITKTPQGSLKEQVENLKQQIKGLKNLVLDVEESSTLSGQPATYLVIRYSQETVEADYLGIWIIVERDPYYYWLSFQILQEHFDERSLILKKVLETFKFLPIHQSK